MFSRDVQLNQPRGGVDEVNAVSARVAMPAREPGKTGLRHVGCSDGLSEGRRTFSPGCLAMDGAWILARAKREITRRSVSDRSWNRPTRSGNLVSSLESSVACSLAAAIRGCLCFVFGSRGLKPSASGGVQEPRHFPRDPRRQRLLAQMFRQHAPRIGLDFEMPDARMPRTRFQAGRDFVARS